MGLSNTEKKIGVTVTVDANQALKAFKQYEGATDSAKQSTKEFGEGLEVWNARAQNAKENAKRAAAEFSKMRAAQQQAFGVMKAGAATVTIAAYALDRMSQRAMQNANVTRNLKISIDEARTATRGFVSDMDLARSAALAASFGVVKSDKEFASLAETAQKLAFKLGKDTSEALEDLTTAISRQSPMILDNLGITLKASEAQDIYARSLGKTADRLTDAEKAEAFRYAALKKAEESVKDVSIETDSGAANIQKFKAQVINATDASLGWASENWEVIESLGKMAVSMGGAAGAALGQSDNMEKLEEVNKRNTDALKANLDAISKWRVEIGKAVSPTDDLRRSVLGLVDALWKLRPATETDIKLGKDIADTTGIVNVQAGLSIMQANAADLDWHRMMNPDQWDTDKKKGGKGDPWKQQRAEFEAALAASQRQAGFNAMNRDMATARSTFAAELGPAQDAQAMREAGRVMGELRRQDAAEALAAQQQKNEALLNEQRRALEIATAEGLDPIARINQQEQMEVAFHERELEMLRTHGADKNAIAAEEESIAQAHHKAKLARIAEEAAARKKALADMVAGVGVFDSVMQGSIGLGMEVVAASERSERRKAEIANKMLAGQAFGIAAIETVKAAAAFASFNPIGGAMHTAAAALAVAKGGLLASGTIGPMASVGAASPGGSASSSFNREQASAPKSTAPISRKGEQHASPAAAGGGGISVVNNFNSYLPADEERAGHKIRQMLEHSGQRFGSN